MKPAVCLASLVILLWGVPAPPAWGTEITAGSLLTAEPANLGHTAEGPGLAQPFDLLSRALSIGEADVLAMEMIRDENRSTLDLYTASRETTIPLASAQLYIVHAVRVSQIKRGKVEEVAPSEAPPPPAWLVKQLPTELPSIADIDKFAKLLERHPLPEFKGVRPVDWLFEQDGLFSGRPWSWENFLPRLATVAVIVLGGLFAVEALHALLSLGRRAMGNGGRGKGKS